MSFVKQHLIDPMSCIRCDGCRLACESKAIDKIDGTLVIDFELCDGNGACTSACDTGAINAWRIVTADSIFSKAEQAIWQTLPDQQDFGGGIDELQAESQEFSHSHAPASALPPQVGAFRDSAPAIARVVTNRALTEGTQSSIHHVVFDLSGTGMKVAEGQSVGILAPGTDPSGARHAARLYSVASSRQGEHSKPGHVAFTVKRVTQDDVGQAHHGVCSNYVCDLQPGDSVSLTGPFGATFLMPEDPEAQFVMICTGTGIAPMRGMISQLVANGTSKGRTRLFYGGRTRRELPYLAEFEQLAIDGKIMLSTALSREVDKPKRYVQDALLANADKLAGILSQRSSHVYVCGLLGMEEGVIAAISEICGREGLNAATILDAMRTEGRLHVETY
ncbi:MAG: FAD-binding oxidoreductase [Novosphingobium sp.]|jgi:benzoyl-CoA 2,3-dioxygenase component A